MDSMVCRVAAIAVAAAISTSSAISWAQPARYGPPPRRDVITVEERGPNAALLSGGAALFGLPYAASVMIAAASGTDYDARLYIPVVGPFLNLAARPSCGDYGCPPGETANRVLLVGDGILQTVGVLQMAGALMFPETRRVTRTIRVAPMFGAGTVGLTAVGAF
jgi:hypothetical protein